MMKTYLDHEKPPPAGYASYAAHMQNTVSQ